MNGAAVPARLGPVLSILSLVTAAHALPLLAWQLAESAPAIEAPVRFVMRLAEPTRAVVDPVVAPSTPVRPTPARMPPVIETAPAAAPAVSLPAPAAAEAPTAPGPVLTTATENPAAPEIAPPPRVAESRPPAAPEPVVAARFDAAYLNNPAPAYPALSRRLGEQGRVWLRVRVDADGGARQVELKEGSGFGRLDRAALEAVARWRFVPARQGQAAVDSWVLVPVSFTLS